AYGNLVDASSPAGPFDLIVCRNVLMYFTPAQARAVIARLHSALCPDGHLLVSAAETSSTLFSAFHARVIDDVTLYARAARAQARVAVTPAPTRRRRTSAPKRAVSAPA